MVQKRYYGSWDLPINSRSVAYESSRPRPKGLVVTRRTLLAKPLFSAVWESQGLSAENVELNGAMELTKSFPQSNIVKLNSKTYLQYLKWIGRGDVSG